jgi:bifunctional non-homologous end joining protein LigD
VARWLYEEKCDGWRMVAHKAGDVVRFISRNGRDHTRRFPDLVGAIAELPTATLIVDGEVSIFDQQLVSRFEWLRHGKPPGVAPPPLFMAFDCLVLGVRRDILDRLLYDQTAVLPARRLSGQGLEAWEQVIAQGYEGLVAKDPASKYVAGRTFQWLKVKQPQYRVGERGWEPTR